MLTNNYYEKDFYDMTLSKSKTAFSAFLLFLGAMFYLPTATQANEITDARVANGINLHVTAEFQSVGFITVQHESFVVPRMDSAFWANNNRLIKDTRVSVHGAPGELVSVSCAILGSSIQKDCDGSKLRSREIISGDSIDTGVAITADMIGTDGKAKKFVSMQISYI